jgi:CBS domain containing-hemolysin-like protein
MESYSLKTIASFIALLICSGFFSAAETAFSSINKIKLKHLAQKGNRRAGLTLEMAGKYDRLLSSVLIGNNIVNILASSLAAVFFTAHYGAAGVTIATAVTTVLVLIFGEISPKTMAKETPEKFAMLSAYPLRLLMTLFTPFNYLNSQWKKIIVRVFRIRADNKVTEDELLTFVEEVRHSGGINEGEEYMIRSAIAFDDVTTQDILTPRVDITAVSITDTVDKIENCFYETGYSRLPVYRGSIDTIVGVILLKDFAYAVLKKHETIESITKPVMFINGKTKINRLLKSFQKKKMHLAVVLDEYGGTTGIVTMEDIVEELVGEIWDEHDEVEENITAFANNTYRIRGNTPLKDFFETLGLDEKDTPANAATAGGWAAEYMGEIPQEGHCFYFKDFTVTILKTEHNRVLELMVNKTTTGK